MILIINNFINLTSLFFITNGFTLVFLNIFVYIFLLILVFGLFFIFDLRYIRTLNELKFFGNLSFISITLAIVLLSMAGLPPLFGFMGKFLFFIFLVKTSNLVIFLLFSFINFFIVYFYIQNLRFLISKRTSFYFYFKNFFIFINFNLLVLLVFFNFFNFIGIFLSDDFINFFIFVNSYLLFN